MLDEAAGCTKERAVEVFNYHTSTLYTVPFQAVCIAQILPRSRSLVEFCPLVTEAFLAFYSGYRAASIAALIPIVEGALKRIVAANGNALLTIPDAVEQATAGAVTPAVSLYFEQMWVPREYATTDYLLCLDERVLIFESFRLWLHQSFFQHTNQYDGATWLNRHLFAHGTSSSWQQTANFCRLLIVLATLALIESWYDDSGAVSLLFPDMDDDGRLLWQQALFQAEAQLLLKQVAEKRYHEYGRLVPELPTDNGALLRKTLLIEDCIKDLVRPLRDAKWSVEVSEPEDDGLYMTVRATAGDQQLAVALLYSCATSNVTYRTLAEHVDVILYRGAPYRQDQFAYGLNIPVGPVTGWQPPTAPT